MLCLGLLIFALLSLDRRSFCLNVHLQKPHTWAQAVKGYLASGSVAIFRCTTKALALARTALLLLLLRNRYFARWSSPSTSNEEDMGPFAYVPEIHVYNEPLSTLRFCSKRRNSKETKRRWTLVWLLSIIKSFIRWKNWGANHSDLAMMLSSNPIHIKPIQYLQNIMFQRKDHYINGNQELKSSHC